MNGDAIESDPVDDTTELADSTELTSFAMVPLDRSFFMSPTVVGAVGGIAIGLSMLLWPNRTNRVLAQLIGVALVWIALTLIVGALRGRSSILGFLSAVAIGAVGGFLLLGPNQSEEALGRLLGAACLALTIRYGLGSGRRLEAYVGVVAVGVLLLAFPALTLAMVTTLAAIVWIAISVVAIVASLDSRQAGAFGYASAVDLVGAWIRERPKTAADRQTLYDKILYEGPAVRQRVIRFFALMSFASVISSMGIITDSTAVVIGAMLIAPLMTPLMAVAMSLVMGWPNRMVRNTAIAVGGILTAIAIGVLLGLISPAIIDTASNTQILSRSNPTILDLATATAAGAAGAYAISRPDVSDSLPGVAIAISLVPPLTVVGIAYSQGDWSAGHGALLLFTTNMVAILTVGGLTFVLTGVTPLERLANSRRTLAVATSGVAVLLVIVIGALFLNGSRAASNLLEQDAIASTVEAWLASTDAYRVVSISTDDDTVTAVIVGPSEGLPDPTDLAVGLSDALERTMTADVRHVVEQRFVVSGP